MIRSMLGRTRRLGLAVVAFVAIVFSVGIVTAPAASAMYTPGIVDNNSGSAVWIWDGWYNLYNLPAHNSSQAHGYVKNVAAFAARPHRCGTYHFYGYRPHHKFGSAALNLASHHVVIDEVHSC